MRVVRVGLGDDPERMVRLDRVLDVPEGAEPGKGDRAPDDKLGDATPGEEEQRGGHDQREREQPCQLRPDRECHGQSSQRQLSPVGPEDEVDRRGDE